MEGNSGGLGLPIVNPIRIRIWAAKLKRKTYELISVVESTLLSFDFKGLVSIVEQLIFSTSRGEAGTILAKFKAKIRSFEDILLSELINFRVNLKVAVSMLDGIILRYIFHEEESIFSKLKMLIFYVESILLHVLTMLILRLKATVLMVERIVLNCILYETIIDIFSKLELELKPIEGILVHVKNKSFLMLKNTVFMIEWIALKLSCHDHLDVARLSNFKIRLPELIKISESLFFTFKAKQAVNVLDRIGGFLLKLVEETSISRLLKLHLSGMLESISVSEEVKNNLKLLQVTSPAELLYYEIYPYEYSLDIISGYPSKMFPSLDIKRSEVKTYGEVTIS
ncbi:MAG: hypothetical protein DRP00_00205 [Candidatus Aenigmatarchaeota archaeon]|nr:MAG: hypothetical protein DRP00_00205 [Candidatus Aenigmarchaeota archaeon]